MLPHLSEIKAMGHQPFFLVTLMDNPRVLDPKCPGPETSIATLSALADALPGRVTWRYDPIVLSAATPPDWHRATFERLASALSGLVDRVTVSFMEPYRKIGRRLAALAQQGIVVPPLDPDTAVPLLTDLHAMAAAQGMTLTTCCQPEIFQQAGIPVGRCIDPIWIGHHIGIPMPPARDPHQRPYCGCAPSKDIGAYDTCLFGCAYCYASTNFDRARAAYARHDPEAASLG
jgi:DNA repair photolyase